MVFKCLGCHFKEKRNRKYLLASMKTLQILKNVQKPHVYFLFRLFFSVPWSISNKQKPIWNFFRITLKQPKNIEDQASTMKWLLYVLALAAVKHWLFLQIVPKPPKNFWSGFSALPLVDFPLIGFRKIIFIDSLRNNIQDHWIIVEYRKAGTNSMKRVSVNIFIESIYI